MQRSSTRRTAITALILAGSAAGVACGAETQYAEEGGQVSARQLTPQPPTTGSAGQPAAASDG